MRMRQIAKAAAAVATVCALTVLGLSAGAQPPPPPPGAPAGPGAGPGGPGGPGAGRGAMLSPELMAKAWALEAQSVSKSLGLNDELSKKVLDAYKAARESHTKAMMEKLGQGGGDRGAAMTAMREVTTAEKGKLETALKAFLSPEQTTKALETLGTFNMRWDGIVSALDGLGLEEKAKTDAMNVVSAYIVESSKAMAAVADGGDREAARAKNAELRTKLEADLGKILTPEQMTKLQSAPGMRRGGGGRPGGPGGPGQGGLGGGGGTPPPPPAATEANKEKKDK